MEANPQMFPVSDVKRILVDKISGLECDSGCVGEMDPDAFRTYIERKCGQTLTDHELITLLRSPAGIFNNY